MNNPDQSSDWLDEILQAIRPATQLGIKTSYADENWAKVAIQSHIDAAVREARIGELKCLKHEADTSRQPYFIPYVEVGNRLAYLTKDKEQS